jgi:fluoride ion exporter CrcB/FEX
MTALIQGLDRHPYVTGWIGSLTTLSASVVTALQHLDLFFRVATGALGMTAGLLTVLITWRKWRKPDA